MTPPVCRLCGGPVVLERNPARAVACGLAGEWVHCDCRAAQPLVLEPVVQARLYEASPVLRAHGRQVADVAVQQGLFDEGAS